MLSESLGVSAKGRQRFNYLFILALRAVCPWQKIFMFHVAALVDGRNLSILSHVTLPAEPFEMVK
jgi:hypothetical protein